MFHSVYLLYADPRAADAGDIPAAGKDAEVTVDESLWEGGTSVMIPEPEYSLSNDLVSLVRFRKHFYFREQRAKRTCLYVHLATAARVRNPDASIRAFDLSCFYIMCDF